MLYNKKPKIMFNPVIEKEKMDKYIKMMADMMESAGEVLNHFTLIYLMAHLETAARKTLDDIGKAFPNMLPMIKVAKTLHNEEKNNAVH